MQSRMDKYYENDIDDSSITSSRTKKNRELYKEVGVLELEDFDLNNNVSIIGDSTESIILDDIQDILSEKYRDNNRNKSIGDTEEIELPKINLDETREYDLNSILEKVKSTKEVDYEEERLKKVRNSQYDILNDLDKFANDYVEKSNIKEEIVEKEEIQSKEQKQEKELLELIDTIVAKELISDDTEDISIPEEDSGELDPLDLLSDLRGDDDTKVMGAIHLDKSDVNEIDCIEDDEMETKKKEVTEEVKVTKVSDDTLSNSFATASIKITDDDFDDFADLKEKGGFSKILIKVIIFALIVAFVYGIILFFTK